MGLQFIEIFLFSYQLESLASELKNALNADNQISAERNYLESKVVMSKPGSDAMVDFSEKLLRIKQKQLQLNVGVIDTIKVGLEDRFSREDEMTIGIAGFPEDSPDLSLREMPAAIEAKLLETFKPREHITVADFFTLVYAQPWHAEDAVMDVRFEEKISELTLNVDTLNTEAKLLDGIIRNNQEKMDGVKAQVLYTHICSTYIIANFSQRNCMPKST